MIKELTAIAEENKNTRLLIHSKNEKNLYSLEGPLNVKAKYPKFTFIIEILLC